jgi:hypothetical protein
MKTNLIIGVVAIGGLFLLVALMSGGKNDTIVTSDTSKTETAAVKVPADMPTNVPMYPGSVVTGVNDQTNNGKRNITLQLLTPDSVADVNTWYRGALKSDGWAITSDKTIGGYVLLESERENVSIYMQAANGNGGVMITERIQIK